MATTKKIKDAMVTVRMEGYEPISKNQIRCTCCGKWKSVDQSNFYKSYSPIHKGNTAIKKKLDKKTGNMISETVSYAPFCSSCIEKYLRDADVEDILLVLRWLDKPYLKDIWESTWDKHAHKSKPITVFGYYMKNIALNHKDRLFKDSDNPDNEDSTVDIKDDKRTYNKQWMGNYTKSEISYLNDYLKQLKEDFNIITKNHIDYAKKIAKASLVMDKEYEKIIEGSGNVADYDKYKKIFDDLSKSAQFAESGRGKSAISNGIAEIVETVENKQWIYKKDSYDEDDIDLLLKQFGNIDKSL